MTTVFAVREHIPFEGSEVVSVFSTKERAERYIANREYRKPWEAGALSVVAWKVRG